MTTYQIFDLHDSSGYRCTVEEMLVEPGRPLPPWDGTLAHYTAAYATPEEARGAAQAWVVERRLELGEGRRRSDGPAYVRYGPVQP